ncbi:MAG: zinc ribbon domain-containing protein [Saccharothrix sp.]|nr:zinc ribbon domain-containing protein [Saccharothrix sp.]
MQPGAVQPGAVQPGDRKPSTAHRPRLTERRTPQPGDLICGQCGEANPPTRKFCSRCGAQLVEAAVVAEKWWRRFLPDRRPPEAGTRPGRRAGTVRRGVGRVLRWSFVVALLAAIGAYGLIPSFRGLVNTTATGVVRDVKGLFVTDLTPVRPVAVSATAESPGHPPQLAADNATNTFWLAPVTPQPPALVLDFGREVDLREAIVRVGNPEDLQAAHRPKKLHLVYPTGETFDVDLADTPDEQRVKIEGSAGSSKVEVHVVELHRSLRGDEVAIAEIEFFAVR